MLTRSSSLGVLSLVTTLAAFGIACGSSSSSGAPADPAGPAALDASPGPSDPRGGGAANDAASAADADAGPSVLSQMPQIKNGGGAVLAHPKAIVISFPGDPLAPDYEQFATDLAASTYFTDTMTEYGVGALDLLAPVHLQKTAPASLTDAQAQAILENALGNPANAFPPVDPTIIYALLIPNGVTVTGAHGGTSCGFGGYHRSFALADGTVIPYAIIAECSPTQATTRTLAHELAEAATDPYADVTPAYVGVGPLDLGFVVGSTLGTEVGDMCETRNPFLFPSGKKVARVWSNQNARKGSNPCLPVPPGEPYIMALPTSEVPDIVVGTGPKGAMPAIEGGGYALASGATRVVELGLIGDPGAPSWTVSVHEVTPTGTVTFALDRATGQAGDRLMLTMTAQGDTTGGVPFAIDSVLGTTTSTWLGVVGAPEP